MGHALFVVAVLVGLQACGAQSQAAAAPAVVETAEVPEPSATPQTVSEAPDRGDRACAGSPTPELIEAVQKRAEQTQGCFDRALRENPKLAGRMRVTVRIERDGRVSAATVTADEIEDATLRHCVIRVFLQPIGVSPEGGCLDAVVPLNFQPRYEEQADGGP